MRRLFAEAEFSDGFFNSPETEGDLFPGGIDLENPMANDGLVKAAEEYKRREFVPFSVEWLVCDYLKRL